MTLRKRRFALAANHKTGQGRACMKKLASVVIFGALILLIGGGLFLAAWDIPVPATDIERIIPNDRFPR